MMRNKSHRRPVWLPDRREALVIGLGGFFAALPFARQRPLPLVRREIFIMGTKAEFAVLHRNPQVANQAIDDGIAALELVDETMSRFKAQSDIGRVNTAGMGQPVVVRRETTEVIEAALGWAEDSSGRFDPCLARASNLWDVGHRHEPPPSAAVVKLAGRGLFRSVEVARRGEERLVIRHDEDAALDLGAIAKGYAVDRAVDAIRATGVEHALVGVGGDLYALGRSPANDAWRIGVQSPDDAKAIAHTLLLEDAAVATSGDYEQFFWHGGRRYHHLLDPATAAPRVCGQRSVSVVAPTCMAADAAATAVFGMSPADADRLLVRREARIAVALSDV